LSTKPKSPRFLGATQFHCFKLDYLNLKKEEKNYRTFKVSPRKVSFLG